MTTTPPKRLIEAQEKWLDAQRQGMDLIQKAKQPGSETDWAEGFRWLTRLSRMSLEYVVEKNDPLFPVIYNSQDEYRKFIVDNPDVEYYFARIDDQHTYRLYGNRGEAAYMGFTIGTDIFNWGKRKDNRGTISQSHLDQYEVAENGDFEVLLSPTPQKGNWLKLEEGSHHLAIRQTFYDKQNQRRAVFKIEQISEKLAPPVLTVDEYADKLETAAHYFLFVIHTVSAMYEGSAANTNRIVGASGRHHVESQDDQVRSHSDADMAYMGGRWDLEPGQALRVTMKPPPYDFVYWGLVLVNPWMESYDYRWTRTCTNNGVAEKNADGTWTLVISPEDPGVPNWLDTGGRLQGFMLLRWCLAGQSPPQPDCELVSVDSLKA